MLFYNISLLLVCVWTHFIEKYFFTLYFVTEYWVEPIIYGVQNMVYGVV